MYRNIDLYLKLEAVIDLLADAVQIQQADSVGFTEVQSAPSMSVFVPYLSVLSHACGLAFWCEPVIVIIIEELLCLRKFRAKNQFNYLNSDTILCNKEQQ